MGVRVIWEGGRLPGPRERLTFFSNLAAPSLTAGKGFPSNSAQLEVPQSTALTPRGAASGSDFNPDIYPTSWQAAGEKDRCGQGTLNERLYGKLIHRGEALVPRA